MAGKGFPSCQYKLHIPSSFAGQPIALVVTLCALSRSRELLQGQPYKGPSQINGGFVHGDLPPSFALTGWTRIGLIGLQMAQKRSSACPIPVAVLERLPGFG